MKAQRAKVARQCAYRPQLRGQPVSKPAQCRNNGTVPINGVYYCWRCARKVTIR